MAEGTLELLAGQMDEAVAGVEILAGVELVALLAPAHNTHHTNVHTTFTTAHIWSRT